MITAGSPGSLLMPAKFDAATIRTGGDPTPPFATFPDVMFAGA
jgi:hypothetical protein